MNRNDVIDVLTAVAAADRRTVGDADVDVWQAIIGEQDRDLCLRAVRDHLRHQPGVWIEPGHVYQRVRTYIRDQLEREPAAAREARQEALAVKAAEDAEELAERKGLPGHDKFRRRPPPLALKVRCPWCKANIGNRCVVPNTNERPAGGFHPSRVEAASVNA